MAAALLVLVFLDTFLTGALLVKVVRLRQDIGNVSIECEALTRDLQEITEECELSD